MRLNKIAAHLRYFSFLLIFLVAGFCALGQSPCDFTWQQTTGNDVQFANSFQGCILSESWNFGDGNTSVDVPNPVHTYYPFCYPNRIYQVTHTVWVDVNGVVQPHTCTQQVEIACTESSSCTDRYFQYQVNGCTVSMASTVGGLAWVTWDFGDNSDPVITTGPVSHTYATPGVYTITQTYQALPPNNAFGTCARQVKIGCCCNGISDFDPVFVNDCCSMLLNLKTKCQQEGRCSKWEITVGNNPTVFLTGTEVKDFLITNYSTYGNSGSNPDIVVKHTTYCAGQEVITQRILRTPIEGIFLGGQPGQPGVSGSGCSPVSSLLSAYTVLPTGTLSPTNVNAPGEQVNLYIAKNSVIQVNQSYTFQGGATTPTCTASTCTWGKVRAGTC